MNKTDEAKKIIEEMGGTSAVSAFCDITPQAVSQWKIKGIPKPWLKLIKTHQQLKQTQTSRP